LSKVLVEPIGVTVEIDDGSTLLPALKHPSVDGHSDCNGVGTCGKCLVRVGAGQVTAPTEIELRKLPADRLAQGWRLACQTKPVSARVSIEVRSTGGRRQMLTASKLSHGAAHPAVTRQVVRLAPPTLADARGDLQRLVDALPGADVPFRILDELPLVLRRNDWKATYTRYGDRVVDIEPADAPAAFYGVAVDIGTSKIVSYLFDLQVGRCIDQEALENPQIRFGEDVITRIAHAADGLAEITAAARQGINDALHTLYVRQGITARHVYDMTIVGNTAMHHLVLGLPPEGLGQAPFAPVVDSPLLVRAAELGLDINPEGGVYLPPPIAGFVGSDALAVIAATRLAGKRKPTIAIDIGTNTEIALVVDGKLVVTSCASGPAFEGYQITHGMKAVQGAIEKLKIGADGKPHGIRTIGDAPPVGLCGSGVVDLLAGLLKAGIVQPSGRMVAHPRVRPGADGVEYVVVERADGDIVFTQHDVRALQLAKGAIATGWTLLLAGQGVAVADIDRIYVAGAFGNYLDLTNAIALGLLPPVDQKRVAFVGNAAGVGAQMALIDVRARKRMARLRARATFLELGAHKDFNEAFNRRLTLG
jgi:uncharacterized 2Fe-2S/4Fe-4S cluster protein (DUF4445 family)